MFRRVLMDPPWLERGGGKSKRGADRHYPLMHTPDIVTTITDCPLWRGVDASAHLWCWVTDNFLRDGLGVMEALGFRYVRTMCWVKLQQNEVQIGLGQYLRGAHELCLFGVRGDAMVPPPENRPPSVVLAPRGRHSAKPAETYEVIERVSPGPGLEIFARTERPGWTAWGNEIAA